MIAVYCYPHLGVQLLTTNALTLDWILIDNEWKSEKETERNNRERDWIRTRRKKPEQSALANAKCNCKRKILHPRSFKFLPLFHYGIDDAVFLACIVLWWLWCVKAFGKRAWSFVVLQTFCHKVSKFIFAHLSWLIIFHCASIMRSYLFIFVGFAR